jgi:hypothetical protein
MKPVKNDKGIVLNGAVLSADTALHQHMKCPACGKFEFADWPVGWDGHAQACEAVESVTPEERRTEFKNALRHLIR